MSRLVPTILLTTIGIALTLFGTYEAFFLLAGKVGPGPVLGLIGVALTVGSLLICWGIVFAARWYLGRTG